MKPYMVMMRMKLLSFPIFFWPASKFIESSHFANDAFHVGQLFAQDLVDSLGGEVSFVLYVFKGNVTQSTNHPRWKLLIKPAMESLPCSTSIAIKATPARPRPAWNTGP